jgi:dTDP-4-amino-4,6-dideoxygalactose transaminase
MEEKRVINFFNYPALFTSHEEDFINIYRDVMRRGAFIMQKDLSQFESNLAEYLGVKHAIGVADGTIALVLILKAIGLQPGDEVIVPSHTFVASAASVHHAGGIPVLVDCGSDHLIDATSVKQAITSKTKAIMPVQLNGRTANMDVLQDIAAEHKLLIVEDSAQALGSKFKNKYAGTFGIAGTFSFFPAKLVGCFGDGGAVVTNDDEVAEKVLTLRDHGRSPNGETVMWGFNARLDNLQAAFLDYRLSSFEDDIARRRDIAGFYDENLRDISQLTLPPSPFKGSAHFDVYQNYEIEADNRDELRAYLQAHGIGTIIQWGGKAVHQFKNLGFNLQLPNTEKLFERCLMLPMNTSLTDDEIKFIGHYIRLFYKEGEK